MRILNRQEQIDPMSAGTLGGILALLTPDNISLPARALLNKRERAVLTRAVEILRNLDDAAEELEADGLGRVTDARMMIASPAGYIEDLLECEFVPLED